MSTIGNKEVFAKNLAKYIDESGKTRSDICNELGIAYSTFSEWANGRKYPRIDKIELIANYFGVKKSDLIEEPSAAPNSPQAQELTLLDNKKIRMIPVYNSVSAGFGAYADECRVGFMPIYVEHDYDAENMLAINVKGDSMYPKIEDGDTIVVRKQNDFENGDIVVVLIDKNEGLVKKIFAEKDKVTLVSINPEYKDRVFEGAEIERLDVVGVVKKLVKDI